MGERIWCVVRKSNSNMLIAHRPILSIAAKDKTSKVHRTRFDSCYSMRGVEQIMTIMITNNNRIDEHNCERLCLRHLQCKNEMKKPRVQLAMQKNLMWSLWAYIDRAQLVFCTLLVRKTFYRSLTAHLLCS